MRLGVVTLFPELFSSFFDTSLVKRARNLGRLEIHLESLREHGIGRHRSVDDTPYGGGAGMVMRVDCLLAGLEAAEAAIGGRSLRVLLTPQGVTFTQKAAEELAGQERVVLICGRYEGFDERIRDFVDCEISLGDFVLIGGEVAAMAVIEASSRLLPGVLGNACSAVEESFSPAWGGQLEYPQYTRPAEFRGQCVPAVLTSGDHARIAAWRREQAGHRTTARRPDLGGAPGLHGDDSA